MAEAQKDQRETADKLIAVFQERDTDGWRRLIASSRLWPTLADGVFKRLDERVAAAPSGSDARAALRRFARRLRSVAEETRAHAATLAAFEGTPGGEWEALAVKRRRDLTAEFFEYLQTLAAAAGDDLARREELAAMGARLAALATATDKAEEDLAAQQAAAQELKSLLEVESMEEADKRLDDLAAQGRLNPALLLMMAKAHAAAKESSYTKEEAKDVMAHLYFKAKESFAAQQPPEVRIMKHLLSLDDPAQRRAALGEAFTPGAQVAIATQDYLTTTPEALLRAVEAVLGAYAGSRGGGTMLGQASALVDPQVITRLGELRDAIRRDFT
ncbi:hypothetical protein WJX81_001023 [Elliptochloris bilobata]|uniref:Uncharacterized protein n=1 Tax=Elliptochloris bilobata TaxID=381761 RepID=A0AAW1S3R9_9CHLO